MCVLSYREQGELISANFVFSLSSLATSRFDSIQVFLKKSGDLIVEQNEVKQAA